MGTILEGYTFENRYTIVKCLLKQFTTAFQPRPCEGLAPSPASGVMHPATTARLLQAGTSVSTSVNTSPDPERPGTSRTVPENSITKLLQNTQESFHNMQINTNPLR